MRKSSPETFSTQTNKKNKKQTQSIELCDKEALKKKISKHKEYDFFLVAHVVSIALGWHGYIALPDIVGSLALLGMLPIKIIP